MTAVFAVLAGIARIVAVARRKGSVSCNSRDQGQGEDKEPYTLAHRVTSEKLKASLTRNPEFLERFFCEFRTA
jgi:hypothetical protein